jgi:hypothetical protein
MFPPNELSRIFALYVFPNEVSKLPESSQQSSRKGNPSIEKRYCCNAVAAAATQLRRAFLAQRNFSKTTGARILVAEFTGETFVPRSNLGPMQNDLAAP